MILFLILFPMAAAVITAAWASRRKVVAGAAALAEFAAAAGCLVMFVSGNAEGVLYALEIPGLCGLGLSWSMDGFRALYATVAALLWAVSTLFSAEYMEGHKNQGRYYFFLLFTLGATQGCFLAADLITLFIFFEMMSFASYVWVAQEENEEALSAGETYLAVSVIGGMVLLMGLFILYHYCGTLDMAGLSASVAGMSAAMKWAAGLCMLFGFGAKAGAVPLHIWLPKAHPAAPAPASALLSGILTKVGILGIMVMSLSMFTGSGLWGDLLLVIGTLTMVVGAVLALFSVNLKRTLACSSVSQIGFILVGIGTGIALGSENSTAFAGAILHMVNHSLIKLVLFNAAGVVFCRLHCLTLDDIRGFGRKKPFLAAVFLIGAWSIAGLPLGSGYVSKTLLHEGLIVYRELVSEAAVSGAAVLSDVGIVTGGFLGSRALSLIEALFLCSGGLTFAYMTKLFEAIFVEKNADKEKQKAFEAMKSYIRPVSAAAIGTAAGVLLLLGLVPGLMNRLAGISASFVGRTAFESVRYYSWENLQGMLISVTIGVVVYLTVVRRWMIRDGRYVNRWPGKWDLEMRIYRPLLAGIEWVLAVVMRACDRLVDGLVVLLRRTILKDSPLPHELEEGTVVTHLAGKTLDTGKEILNHTTRKKRPIRTNFEHRLALWNDEAEENRSIISRSLSFGLLLFAFGLLLTLIYLIL